MAKIKVLHIVWSATLGGIERVVLNLSRAQLKNDDLSIGILVAKSDGNSLANFKELNISVYDPQFKNGNDSRAELLNTCTGIFSKYDVLHFHSFNPVLAKLAVKSNRKIIFTEHGNFGFNRKTSLKDYVVRFLQKRFLNKEVDFITFNSEFSKRTSENRYGLKNVNREVVYNGIPSLPENKLQETSSSELLKIVTIGRLASVKRIDRLINAFALADHKKMHLTIVGDGPLRNELEHLRKEKNLEKEITFSGTADSITKLKESDLCVFPSQNEAFGLVAIEAYQCGKAVIAYKDSGGLAELVSLAEPQMLVDSENELAELLNRCQQSPEEFQTEEKQNHRKNFASGFSIEKMEKSLYTIYKRL